MPLREDELQMSRHRRSYRAAIWAFRVALCVLLLQLVLDSAGVLYGVSAMITIVLLLPGGMSILILLESAGLPRLGSSEGNFWRSPKMILKDIFGLGRR